ncbi:hypothetical protein COV11_01705 [Candidatus Woesearchaeota archaeon CG10_big_fil_rev_8_21_14_0_10_30_7]|nr:MAG: hypothetical protein COV11_01705 [Candidatus Woesearchaeota archaeon CG10_big_fil_rev_8_21_14_0_10_30_7]
MKTIFYDVDTQNDFMNENGALYVPGAENIKKNLATLTLKAVKESTLILGSVDLHYGTEEYKSREGELQRHGGPFPDHCMANTDGVKKISETNNVHNLAHMYIPHFLPNDKKTISESSLELLIYEFLGKHVYKYVGETLVPKNNSTGAILFAKQSYDVTSNPYFNFVIGLIKPEKAIVYGVATDYCVKAAVEGLLKHNIEVHVVTDAIKGISEENSAKLLLEWKTQGVTLVTTRDVVKNNV